MTFSNGYNSPMDRTYHNNPATSGYVGRGVVGIRDIGSSVISGQGAGRFQRSVDLAIRGGAGRLELVPTQQEGMTVESYTKEEREEIRALAKINELDLMGVHAPPQVGNVSGLTQNGFSDEARFESLEEVKKHIDFAADALGGGHIVVHTGEFPRGMAGAEWNTRKDEWSDSFEEQPGEEGHALYYFVDPKSGKFVDAVREDEEVFMPQTTIDPNTGEEIYLTDDKTGEFQIQKVTFKEYKEDYAKRNSGKQIDNYQLAKEFLEKRNAPRILQAEGQAKEYETQYQMAKMQAESFNEQISRMREGGASENELKQAEIQLDRVKRQMEYTRNISVSARQNVLEHKRQLEKLQTVKDYAKAQSFDSMSDLGIYAMKTGKERKVEKPLFIAAENIFPRMGYGSHPEELIDFVQGARKEMVRKLVDPHSPHYMKGLSEREAKKAAETHLKATFDTQHLGMWYKHFKHKPGEGEEQRHKRFNKWYMGQVEKLQKSGIIGHIHIVDGFGRGHTHLGAGEGELPVVEAVEYLKKKGYKGHMMSEAWEKPGRQLTSAWEAFGSPIYRAIGGSSGVGSFSDIQNSYFGSRNPPANVFGNYAPSQDWGFYTGIGLE